MRINIENKSINIELNIRDFEKNSMCNVQQNIELSLRKVPDEFRENSLWNSQQNIHIIDLKDPEPIENIYCNTLDTLPG